MPKESGGMVIVDFRLKCSYIEKLAGTLKAMFIPRTGRNY